MFLMMYVPQNGCRVRATGCLKACGLTLKPNPVSSVAPDGPHLFVLVLFTQTA
jgi:hypothetical protein